MRVSLIISTYNRADALQLVMDSVSKQLSYPHEVLIADDGSSDDTAQVIKSFNQNSVIKFEHLWQADEGFRLSKVRNMALAKANGDYIIFIDGDMVLHPRFVESHIKQAKKGFFLQGSRVILNKMLTERALSKKQLSINIFSSGIRNRHNMIDSPILSNIVSHESDHWDTVRGCSMSFWRTDLVKINGFNEVYHHWGREDNDIAVRLMNMGIRRKNIKACAVAYHLYHEERKQDQGLIKNDAQLKETVANKVIRCEKGLSGHLKQ